MYASTSVEGYAMILAHHVGNIRARPNKHAAHRSSKSTYENEHQVMRRWMLHDNVSQRGYGNALSVRLEAILRKDIMRIMMIERIMPRIWMHRRNLYQLSR